MSIRRISFAALAVTALAAGAAAAGDLPFADNTTEPIRPLPRATMVADAHRALGVLRRGRSTGDRLPSVVAAALEREGLMGENPGLAPGARDRLRPHVLRHAGRP